MNAPATAPPAPPLLDDPMPPWRLWLDPHGRVNRATFWRAGVLAPLGMAVLLRALLDIARLPQEQGEQWVSLLLAWPLMAVSAKRWQDRNRSAWWVLLLFVPVIGALWLLIDNGFVRGSAGRNRYGEAPINNGR